MNIIHLTGRLTKDPEAKKTQGGIDYATFSIAVQKPGSKKDDQLPPDYFDCTVWGSKDGPGRAGVIEKYFHKGDGIVLTGSMQSRKYQDKNGNDRTAWGVRVDDFEFPMARKGETASASDATASAGTPPEGAKPDGTFVEVEDGELPF